MYDGIQALHDFLFMVPADNSYFYFTERGLYIFCKDACVIPQKMHELCFTTDYKIPFMHRMFFMTVVLKLQKQNALPENWTYITEIAWVN